jgi:hypothetical protein
MTFAVINNNPVIVKLKHWGCNMSKAYVELMGVAEGNATVISHKLDFSSLSKKQVSYSLIQRIFFQFFVFFFNLFSNFFL